MNARCFSGSRLRQLLYPRECRIRPVSLEHYKSLLEAVEALNRPRPPDPPTQGPSATTLRLLADIGTGLWRLRQRMVKPGTDQPLDDMRRAFRHLQSVFDALQEAGIEIQDHTDKPFDDGMSLKVIEFQPTQGLARPRVSETARPSIYHRGQMIQMGEVFVARPAATDAGEPPAPPRVPSS